MKLVPGEWCKTVPSSQRMNPLAGHAPNAHRPVAIASLPLRHIINSTCTNIDQ
ncbi:hypothetical protein [Endozoicomonas euniceicola]|uniref:Uncharacterized protein n=1 Tax=Endozoicomonas euniceicola TaxID=1234143 RepID=A0ABY6GU02_9GAMM|nr:hypothetical protein [Endozoicomonas euniceicola]UYM16229.1 hypothetical protein NX720_26105 [Endozoicomonas euniceicola]